MPMERNRVPDLPPVPERAATGSRTVSPPSAPDPGRLPVAGLRWWEVADALWLAHHHPGLAADPGGRARSQDPPGTAGTAAPPEPGSPPEPEPEPEEPPA